MRVLCKYAALFAVGALIYGLVEFFWRFAVGTLPVHWTMLVLGGTLFVLLGAFNEFLPWDMSLLLQGILGAIVVTVAELGVGVVLNLWLGLAVWDYSHMPFNLLGQVCLAYTAAWLALSIVAIVLDDWLRYWWFNEERPHYHWIGGKGNG